MRRIATVVVAVTVAAGVAACGDDRTIDELVADGCTHVHAERWLEAREPLKVASEREPRLQNLYSLVRASSEPKPVPAWAANEMGAEAYAGRPTPELVEAWRDNAKAGCERLGH